MAKKKQRYIQLIKIYFTTKPHVYTYGMMCHRSWKSMLLLGLRHLKEGKCTLFYFKRIK